MKMYDVYGNEITTEKARELSKTHKKYINELHDFCVFAKNKYELAKYWNVDFGCDVDEFEEEKENVVKFIINEKKIEKVVLADKKEIKEQFENWFGVLEDLRYPVEEIEKVVGLWNKNFGAWEEITIYYKNGEKQKIVFEW